MRLFRLWQHTDFSILTLLALSKVLLHTLTNRQYGFHRDELATVDDARYLAWGYVAYPPVTPFIARIAWNCSGRRWPAYVFSPRWHKVRCWCWAV